MNLRKCSPWELSPRCLGHQVPPCQLDYGRLAPGGGHTVIITVDPRQTGGELPTCKCAHEQPYCHLVVSERGLGMHLPVTSTSVSAILLAQGEERVEGESGPYLRGLEKPAEEPAEAKTMDKACL